MCIPGIYNLLLTSVRALRQLNFVEQVSQVLRREAINPDRLKLELTESLVLDDIDDSVHKMNATP